MKGRFRDRSGGARGSRHAKALAAALVAVIPLFAACSSSDGPADAGGPSSSSPSAAPTHGPFFPECGGLNDQIVSQVTQETGLVTTAKTSVGCQWLAGGGVLGPHFSFSWFRGSPIGRERKTEELSRTSVDDITIEGHDGFIALNEDPTMGVNLCETGIQFGDDFIEWSVSYNQKPFPDACEVVKELTRQSIVNSK